VVDAENRCGIYANLENENEAVNLNATVATPGLTGVWRGASEGENGTNIYYQLGK
jgi:hypothetical protein